jgi:CubicO group peptidase (beta-lactamase class C family)
MRFLIASVSKILPSVAVQKLAEEGRLSLDGTIDWYLAPRTRDKDSSSLGIRVRQLLSHTIGSSDNDEESSNLGELANPDLPVPYRAGFECAFTTSPLFRPRTDCTYSNENDIFLTHFVARAGGIPNEGFATRTHFLPLSA